VVGVFASGWYSTRLRYRGEMAIVEISLRGSAPVERPEDLKAIAPIVNRETQLTMPRAKRRVRAEPEPYGRRNSPCPFPFSKS
jgi:hypothetical protein